LAAVEVGTMDATVNQEFWRGVRLASIKACFDRAERH
jgi:hypothetical protein